CRDSPAVRPVACLEPESRWWLRGRLGRDVRDRGDRVGGRYLARDQARRPTPPDHSGRVVTRATAGRPRAAALHRKRGRHGHAVATAPTAARGVDLLQGRPPALSQANPYGSLAGFRRFRGRGVPVHDRTGPCWWNWELAV